MNFVLILHLHHLLTDSTIFRIDLTNLARYKEIKRCSILFRNTMPVIDLQKKRIIVRRFYTQTYVNSMLNRMWFRILREKRIGTRVLSRSYTFVNYCSFIFFRIYENIFVCTLNTTICIFVIFVLRNSKRRQYFLHS